MENEARRVMKTVGNCDFKKIVREGKKDIVYLKCRGRTGKKHDVKVIMAQDLIDGK